MATKGRKKNGAKASPARPAVRGKPAKAPTRKAASPVVRGRATRVAPKAAFHAAPRGGTAPKVASAPARRGTPDRQPSMSERSYAIRPKPVVPAGADD